MYGLVADNFGKPSGRIDLRVCLYQPVFATASMVSDFAKQFVEMEEENVRLKNELAAAKTLVVDEHLKNDKLEKEVAKLKKSLDKEVKARESAKAALAGSETRLHEAAESLLGESFVVVLCIHSIAIDFFRSCTDYFAHCDSCCRYPCGQVRTSSGWAVGGFDCFCD